MLYKALAALALSLLYCAVSSAQTVYEPVASQYEAGGRSFHYGGTDRRVFDAARQRLGCGPAKTALTGLPNGVGYLYRGIVTEPAAYTFRDCGPTTNAYVYGYTAADARHDAYATVPRFFRMADVAATAVPAADGVGVVVPARPAAGVIDIRPSRRLSPPATAPATQPRPVLIIPREMLQPVKVEKAKSVIAAR